MATERTHGPAYEVLRDAESGMWRMRAWNGTSFIIVIYPIATREQALQHADIELKRMTGEGLTA